MKRFFQNKLYYKIYLCDLFPKNQTYKGPLVPTGNPQQETGW